MRMIFRSHEALILELSAYECRIIGRALKDVTMLAWGEGDDQFPREFGWPNGGEAPTRHEVRAIAYRLPGWHDADDGTLYTQGFTRRELEIVIRSLSELANGVSIPEWEFHTLTGVERRDVRDLLHALHRLLVSGRK
jgi:hypothetical protein